MADITRSIPDALHAKIRDDTVGWGTEADWWRWVKDETRREITNRRLRAAADLGNKMVEEARSTILNDTSLNG